MWPRAQGSGALSKCNLKECSRTLASFAALLNACASVVALEEGFQVEKQISQSSSLSDIFACSSLVDMYMPNVGALRTLGGCSMGCLPIMLSVGMP